MVRLLLVAPPFSGHLNPLIAIARRLRERGFDPRFVTGPARVPLLRELGFHADPILAEDPDALERVADPPRAVRSNPVLMAGQLRQSLALLAAARGEIERIVARDRPALVLADFTAPVAGLVAEAAGLPWVTSMPTPFALETRRGTPSYCGGWGLARHPGHRVRDAAGRLGTRAVKRGFGLLFAHQLVELGTRVYRSDGTEAAYSPHAILGLGLPQLEFPRDWPPALQLIGPVTETPEPAVVPDGLLQGDRPQVLVTMGTHLPWVKAELAGQVTRLAAHFPDHEFVVALGRPVAQPAATRIAANVVTCDYLPYDDVLPHVAAVIHHGGAGVVYSTLRAGKPAVVWPRDYDQFDFAARVVAAGAGVRVRNLESRQGVAGLRRVLIGLDGPAIAALQQAVQRSDPFTATERTIRGLLGRPAAPGAA